MSGSDNAASEHSESCDPVIAASADLSGSLGTVRRGRVRTTENRGYVSERPTRPMNFGIYAATDACDVLRLSPNEGVSVAGSDEVPLVPG
jgi:hypothetical protein